jgi:uncharacterized protein (DUF1330 family)
MTTPAYFVFQLTNVHTPEGMQPYLAKVQDTLIPFNGQPVVLGGTLELFEGQTPRGNLVIVRFDTMENARNWYHSAGYQSIIGYRHASAECDAFLLSGLSSV